jgi:hypothetical protein
MPSCVTILSPFASLLAANNSRRLGAAVTAADKLLFPRDWR